MRILITGNAGFIGSALSKFLSNHELMGVDNYSTGYFDNVCIPTKSDLKQAFIDFDPQYCFHLAAYASEGRSNRIRKFICDNNNSTAAEVINLCVRHNTKLIFTSSVAVYSGSPPFDENTIPNPIDEYGLSKWMTEQSIKIAAEQNDLKYCIVRPRNVYGPGQSLWDSQRNVFGIWMNNVLKDEPIKIFGDGEQRRAFTYIDDILPALQMAILVDGLTINLGSATHYSLNEAANIFCEVTGCRKIVHTKARHEVKEAYCDTELSEVLLGFKETTSLKTGLANMWEWAQKQPVREFVEPPMYEI